MVNPEIADIVAAEKRRIQQGIEAADKRNELRRKGLEIGQQVGTDLLELAQRIGVDEVPKYLEDVCDITSSRLLPMGALDEVAFGGETHAFAQVNVMRRKKSRSVTTKGRIFSRTDVVEEVTDEIDQCGVTWWTGNEEGSNARPISDLYWKRYDAANLELLEDLVRRVEIVRQAVDAKE